jgi:23S rRNA (uracil1939-C5)-methyltransferase
VPGALTAPPLDCPKQTRCPGCPLGAEPYEAGLASKGRGLQTALSPYPSLTPELGEPRAASPTQHYRLRAKLVSRGRSLGLFERGSHTVIDVTDCRVLSPALTLTSEALRRLLPLPLHGADLRETSEGVLLSLLTEQPNARHALERAARELVERGEALSVAIALRQDGDVRLLAGEPQVVVGAKTARHRLADDEPYAYAAHGGFVQAHAKQASYVQAELARGLRERLGDGARPAVLELFAGNGSLALALSRTGAQVTAVEAYAPAIALAERAALEQGLALRAVAGDATRFMQTSPGQRFDAVIVNPPRRGLDAELRRAIGRTAPRVLAYVSCNPHTLARDAWHLQRLGLNLVHAEPLDMIPWSDALEALAWFSPQTPPAPRVLHQDDDFLAVEKAPHEAVNSATANTPSLTARVRRLAGCQQARALDAWGEGVSGVCWFAKHAAAAARSRQATCGPGQQRSERTLLVLARGNLRKQGTITRRAGETTGAGSRYKKQGDVGRHALLRVTSTDVAEAGTLRDFASISHPVLGDASLGDRASNQFLEHRHGLDRAFVHCASSSLWVDAKTQLAAHSELAPDLARVLASLGSD